MNPVYNGTNVWDILLVKMFICNRSLLESVRVAQLVSKTGCGKICCYVKYSMAKWSNSLEQHSDDDSEKEQHEINNMNATHTKFQ